MIIVFFQLICIFSIKENGIKPHQQKSAPLSSTIKIFTQNTWLLPYSKHVPLDVHLPDRISKMKEMINTSVIGKDGPDIMFFQEVWKPLGIAVPFQTYFGNTMFRGYLSEELGYSITDEPEVNLLVNPDLDMTEESEIDRDRSGSVESEDETPLYSLKKFMNAASSASQLLNRISEFSPFKRTGKSSDSAPPQKSSMAEKASKLTGKLMDSGLVIATKGTILKQASITFTACDGGDKFVAKGALAAAIKLESGKVIIAVTTHLDSRGKDNTRISQLTELFNFVDDFAAAFVLEHLVNNDSIIIAGDFNMDIKIFNELKLSNPEIAQIFKPYVNCWDNKSNFDNQTTAPFSTYVGTYGGEPKTIDYIFVRSNSADLISIDHVTPDIYWRPDQEILEGSIKDLKEEQKKSIDVVRRKTKATDHAGLIATITI
jgi:endonuclease/exonuclease/phosphatase family metal-dependent hydrolase